MKAIEASTLIQRNPAQVFTEIDGEVVMLSVKKESYFSLNEVGSLIWKEVADPCTMDDLVHRLMKAYEVTAEQCRKEMEPFLHQLVDADIIILTNE